MMDGIATKQSDLEGTWTLESYAVLTGDKVVTPFGDHPIGMSTNIGKRGWLYVGDPARMAPANGQQATDEEAARLYRTMFMWSCIATTDEKPTPDGSLFKLKIDVSSHPALIGTERDYYMFVDGDVLKTKSITQANVLNGTPTITVANFRRMKEA